MNKQNGFIKRIGLSIIISLVIMLSTPAMAAESDASSTNTSAVPDFMNIVVVNEGAPTSKSQIAFDNLYALNTGMFSIYNNSLAIYKQHFLKRQNLIMALFSGKGGQFILYRAG